MKGLGKVIGADPLNKGSSPFGIGPLEHIESLTLADQFLVRQNVDIDSIDSDLLAVLTRQKRLHRSRRTSRPLSVALGMEHFHVHSPK